jgi:periplasmic divalent cation tolerance protein
MKDIKYIVIFVTAKDKRQARKIASKLVEEKLIACANIVDKIHSLFWWEEKVDSSKEVLLILKTKMSLFAKIEKTVKSIHSYSVPEIIAIPIVAGQKDYLSWIENSVS